MPIDTHTFQRKSVYLGEKSNGHDLGEITEVKLKQCNIRMGREQCLVAMNINAQLIQLKRRMILTATI